MKTQRALHKAGKILEDRKTRLESIDFVWDGTQLPIKRKRRRQSEEVDQQENGHAAKRAKTESEATDQKEENENDNTVETIPPQQGASDLPIAASEESHANSVALIVGAIANVNDSVTELQASDRANETTIDNCNAQHGTEPTTTEATDTTVLADSDNMSINPVAAKPTNGKAADAPESEEKGDMSAGAKSNEEDNEAPVTPANGNVGNGSEETLQPVGDAMNATHVKTENHANT